MAKKKVIDLDTYSQLDAWAISLHEMYRAACLVSPIQPSEVRSLPGNASSICSRNWIADFESLGFTSLTLPSLQIVKC